MHHDTLAAIWQPADHIRLPQVVLDEEALEVALVHAPA